MSDDNTQDTNEPSLASAGSVGIDLYGGGFNKWLASIGKTRETATDADDIQWLKLDRHRLNMLWRWIPVTERLPEEGQRVLAYEKPDVIVVAEMHSRMPLVGGFWWSTDNGHTAYSVFPTHWMPLPAPPTDGK